MDTTPEPRKEEVLLERPLSPVLSTGKKSTLKFRGRLRKTSRTNLSKLFAHNEQVLQGSTTRENVCLYFSDLPDPSDNPEVRLKKLQGMEERRREYLKYLTEIHTEGEQIFVTKRECDGSKFKKPLTPVVLKIRKDCTQACVVQEGVARSNSSSSCSRANNDTPVQESENCLLGNNSGMGDAVADAEKDKKFSSLNMHETPVLTESCIVDASVSQVNTILTDSQVNSLADDIESVVSRDAETIKTQENNSYFKYVSKFLDKFEKERVKQYVETSNASQTQAVSDLSAHCKKIMDLIDLVDKNSTSSTTVRTYGCPAFHGFDNNSIKLAKEKANCSNDLVAFYEKHHKDIIHDFDTEGIELDLYSKKKINQSVSIPQIKNTFNNDDFVTLYDNNKRVSNHSRKRLDGGEFDRQKQTQEWFNSCFAETGFKEHCTTSMMETNSDSVSEREDANSVKTINQSKSDKFVCHSPGFGFRCASGKQIKVSETALLNAAKIFDQVIEEVKCGDKGTREQNNVETIHVNSKFCNNSVKDCMTSTTTTNKDYEDSEISTSSSTHTLQVQSAPTVMFACASGKGIAVSKRAFDKATQMLHEVENDTKSLKNNVSGETSSKEFKTAAGSGISVSAEALGAVQKIFVDVYQNQDDTVMCKTPTTEKKPLRKHLGMSYRSKQVPIQQENFEKAKKMFEDISGDMHIESPFRSMVTTAFSCHTPNRQQYHGPYISTPVCNSSPIFFDKFGCDDNRIVDKTKKGFAYNAIESNVIIRSATAGNVSKWLEELNEERSRLEKQLNILALKQQALQQQKMQLESEKLKRPITGTLYTKKRTNEKIPLRKFVENVKPGEQQMQNIDSTLLSITPKNALSVHFVCRSAVLETTDGAKIVPNKTSLIGISEMKTALEAMPGVQSSLIPKDWVENHYKWIVWKLASMERAYPYHFRSCLTVENIMEQLKYRYDREIDRVERSALRRIVEKDDSPQKRMVLCISDIKKGSGELCELELTDGWYAIRTLIDGPLNELIKKRKLKLGFKIVTQGADLINCEGCHPLQAPECVYLKINYNCTRRAVWDTRLGFQSFPGPLLIPLKSINFKGGSVGRIKVYLARLYPLRYMERQGTTVVWRNEKAEERRAKAFISEKLKQLEDVQYEVQNSYEKELEEMQQRKKRKIDGKSVKDHPGGALYDMLMYSGDPESIMSELTPSQQATLEDYKKQHLKEFEEDLAARLKEAVTKSHMVNRDVVPILKLLAVDASDCSERSIVLNIWKPTDELLHVLKEERVFSIYNVIPKNNGNLGTSCKTRFQEETVCASRFKKFSRQVLPIALTMQAFHKPFLNEFDTVGIVVKTELDTTNQDLWLSDFTGRLLLVKVCDSPDHCSVFDHLAKGNVVALSNLILCEPQNSFGFAIGNQYTVVTRYPKDKLLKEALDIFTQQPIENIDSLLDECDKKVSVCLTKLGFINTLQNRSYSETLLARTTALNISDILTDSSEDEVGLPAKLTSLDVAMSLIDMESLSKN